MNTTTTQRSMKRRNIKRGRMAEQAPRQAPDGFSWTKGYGFASRRGKRSSV